MGKIIVKMRLRLLATTVLLLLDTATLLSQQPDSWKEYAYSQDGVAISAPKEPQFVDGKSGHMYVSFWVTVKSWR